MSEQARPSDVPAASGKPSPKKAKKVVKKVVKKASARAAIPNAKAVVSAESSATLEVVPEAVAPEERLPAKVSQRLPVDHASESGVPEVPASLWGVRPWKRIVLLLSAACLALAALNGWLWLRAGGEPAVLAQDAPPPDTAPAAVQPEAAPSAPRTVASYALPAADPTDPAQSKASFLALDEKRGGDWHGDLGGDGYLILNRNGNGQHQVKLPPYVARFDLDGNDHVWQHNEAKDPRALQDAEDPKRRHAVCHYDNASFTLTLEAAQLQPHKLSLYCLDWDKLGRGQRIEVRAGDRILDTQTIEKMDEGAWLHYEVSGSIELRFANIKDSHNAVLSGIFWDTPEGQRIPKRTPPSGPAAREDELKPGLWGEFFDGLRTYANVKDVPLLQRPVASLAFGESPPPQSGHRGLRGWPLGSSCAAIFSGYLKVPEGGAYVFYLASNDGARLYLGRELIADHDGAQAMQEISGKVELAPGLHRIWLEYYNRSGALGLTLHMQKEGGEKAPIPAAQLWHHPSERLTEYLKSVAEKVALR